jgi:hypothetical protein
MAARRPRRWPWLLLAGGVAASLHHLHRDRGGPVATYVREADAGVEERPCLALRGPRGASAPAPADAPDAWYVLRGKAAEPRTGPDLTDVGAKLQAQPWATWLADVRRYAANEGSRALALTAYAGIRNGATLELELRMPEFRFEASETEALRTEAAAVEPPELPSDVRNGSAAGAPPREAWNDVIVRFVARGARVTHAVLATDDVEPAAAPVAPAENGKTFRIARMPFPKDTFRLERVRTLDALALFRPDAYSGWNPADEGFEAVGHSDHARRVFDVRDLGVLADASPAGESVLAPPPFLPGQALATMVTSSVAPASWGTGGGRAWVEGGDLVVRHRPEVLDAVEKRLQELRVALAPKIAEHATAFARRHRAFDVSDLLGEGEGRVSAAGLVAIVTSRVDPPSWRREAKVEVSGDLLVVRQEPERMAEVEAVLARLREALRLRASGAAAGAAPTPATDPTADG